MEKEIAIIGGGINGITTALLLDIAGYKTKIYTEHKIKPPQPYNKNAPKEVASFYPAASIPKEPHFVAGNTEEIQTTSWKFFENLWISGSMGIRKQTHYEAKLDSKDIDNFKLFNDSEKTEVFFVEPPQYFPKIYNLYTGDITRSRLSKKDILDLSEDIIVNCTGYNSRFLFNDESLFALRGHLVYAQYDKIPKNKNEDIFSYNLVLPDKLVYYYPRSDYILLGGSRQKGTPSLKEEWEGEKATENVEIDNIKVPKHILSLNRDILSNTGIELKPETARIGYRPWRKNGPRIEISENTGRKIVHNYGHGGAGVTLSWGSAFKVLRKIEEKLEKPQITIDSLLRNILELTSPKKSNNITYLE